MLNVLPKENKMPDLSDLMTATGCYMASTLAGGFQSRNYDDAKKIIITRFVTLVDKAKYEYLMARDFVDAEIKEMKMTYDEIIARGGGQFMYFPKITNHLENCIITIGILFKLFEKLCEIDMESYYLHIDLVVKTPKISDRSKVMEIREILEKIESLKETKKEIISKKLVKIRNSIVHIEDRIIEGNTTGILLRLNEKGTIISLLGSSLSVSELAEIITALNEYIRKLL